MVSPELHEAVTHMSSLIVVDIRILRPGRDPGKSSAFVP
jgi:hypothetical protein